MKKDENKFDENNVIDGLENVIEIEEKNGSIRVCTDKRKHVLVSVPDLFSFMGYNMLFTIRNACNKKYRNNSIEIIKNLIIADDINSLTESNLFNIFKDYCAYLLMEYTDQKKHTRETYAIKKELLEELDRR